MKRILVGLLGCCLVAGVLNAQPPDTLWTYTYASSENDDAYTIAPTADGGFVVGGKGRAPDSTNGALLIRLDYDGNELWVRRYAAFHSEIRSAIAMEDGGFAMTGDCGVIGNISVVRTDSAGAVQWSLCVPTSIYGEQGWSIAGTADGEIAVLGASYNAHFDIFLVRLAANGDSLWTQTFASPASYKQGALLSTSDGGFLVGTSFFEQANVIKTDSAGTVQWSTSFGSTSLVECVNGLDVAANGDYLMAGTQTREGGFFQVNPYAARLTSSGDTLWSRVYPNLGPAWFYSVRELPNGDIIYGGSTGGSYLLVMCDSGGNVVWSQLYGTPIQEDCRAICLAPDNGQTLAGYRRASHSGSDDIWVVRTGSALTESVQPHAQRPEIRILPNYPNPFNQSTFIRFILDRPSSVNLLVYDVTGRRVEQISAGAMSIGYHQIALDAGNLPSGYYYYEARYSGQSLFGKILLLK
jgi:hypothetical protein